MTFTPEPYIYIYRVPCLLKLHNCRTVYWCLPRTHVVSLDYCCLLPMRPESTHPGKWNPSRPWMAWSPRVSLLMHQEAALTDCFRNLPQGNPSCLPPCYSWLPSKILSLLSSLQLCPLHQPLSPLLSFPSLPWPQSKRAVCTRSLFTEDAL